MPTLVQANLGSNVTTGNQNFTLSSTFTNATTARNFIVIVTALSAQSTAASVNDSMTAPGTSGWLQFGGFTNVQAPAVWRGSGSFWVLPNAPSISNTTSITWHIGMSNSFGTKTAEMVMLEFGGVVTDPNNFFDVQHSATGTGTVPDPGNITTTNHDLVMTGFVGNTGAGLTAPAGFSPGIAFSAVQFAQYAYLLSSAIGTVSSTWSGGTETPWGAGQAAFLPNPTPPPPPTTFSIQKLILSVRESNVPVRGRNQ